MSFFCDFAILTVVREAWDAAVAFFEIEQFDEIDGYVFGFALVRAADGGHHVVAVAQCTARSNIPAGHAATAMLETTRPRYLVLADIGGGFYGEKPEDRDGLELGDVVVGNDIQYFEAEKITPKGMFPRDYSIALPSPGPINTLTHLDNLEPNWHEIAHGQLPKGAETHIPKILDGQIVAGEKLLADPEHPLVARIVKAYDKALAVDMESGGVGGALSDQQRKEIFAQFTVIRGISDFFDKKEEENQETRDNWKPYAAHIALAATRAWVGRSKTHAGVVATGRPLPPVLEPLLGESVPVTVDGLPNEGANYVRRLRSWLATNALVSERGFRLALLTTKVRAVPTITPEPGLTVERGEVLGIVLHDRMVAVVGPSGAGKSILLRQVLRQFAADDDALTVYLDLKKNWRDTWIAAQSSGGGGESVNQALDGLLNASEIDVTATDLLAVAVNQPVLIIVDAINEVSAQAATHIRDTLDQCVRHHPNVRVLVSDRRAGDFYRESRWSVLHLDGVVESAARDVIDEIMGDGTFDGLALHDKKLLRLPFFLDRAVQSGRVHLGSRAAAVHDYLVGTGLSDDDIRQVAPVAFQMYRRGLGTPGEDPFDGLDDTIVAKLQAAEIVTDGVSGLIFSHQLVHQHLAGQHLGSHPEEWTFATLDKVTADAASPDTVGMTIAAIPDISYRDQFLRVVYDWNWRAAVLALIEAQVSDRPVSQGLATALVALAGDKRFDAVKGTRNRVAGLLAELPDDVADAVRTNESPDGLRAQVAATEFPGLDWWPTWRDVFLWTPGDHTLTHREIAWIGSPEPLIGWTVSNSIKRFAFDGDTAALLYAIYRSQQRDEPGASATRWRVVHAVGKWCTRENAEFLFECLTDSYTWVVYGAVRSIVEVAALADSELRTWIIGQLEQKVDGLDAEPLSQIPWASRYRDTDAEWPGAIRPLLHAIRDRQTGGDRDRWDRRLEAFELYAGEHEERNR